MQIRNTVMLIFFVIILIFQIFILKGFISLENKLVTIKSTQEITEKNITEQNILLKQAIQQGLVVVYEDKKGNFIPIHKRIKNK